MFPSMQCRVAFLAFIFANTYADNYILDIIEIKSNTTTPDAVEINLRSVQPARGIYALSGFINFKVDINTDKVKGELKVLYSSNGISYQLAPFRFPSMSLTNMWNHPCTRNFAAAMQECCTGVDVPHPFVQPFSKRVVECENCVYPKDVFPSSMRPGYYKQIILVDGLPNIHMAISVLIKLELDN